METAMQELDAETGLPSLDAGLGGQNNYCDECEHAAIITPRHPNPLRSLLHLRPRPAECQVRVEDVSGLGTMPCGCRNPVHGS